MQRVRWLGFRYERRYEQHRRRTRRSCHRRKPRHRRRSGDIAAHAGFDVVVNYRQDKVGAVLLSVPRQRRYGGQADTGQDADIVRMFEVAAAFGPLTGLVNNAGDRLTV